MPRFRNIVSYYTRMRRDLGFTTFRVTAATCTEMTTTVVIARSVRARRAWFACVRRPGGPESSRHGKKEPRKKLLLVRNVVIMCSRDDDMALCEHIGALRPRDVLTSFSVHTAQIYCGPYTTVEVHVDGQIPTGSEIILSFAVAETPDAAPYGVSLFLILFYLCFRCTAAHETSETMSIKTKKKNYHRKKPSSPMSSRPDGRMVFAVLRIENEFIFREQVYRKVVHVIRTLSIPI